MIVVPMQIRRATAVELASCAGMAAIAGACHYFGLGELPGLLGTGLALAGAAAHAGVGHTLVELVKGVAERAGDARSLENRDLHRLIGEAIARILEQEAPRAPGGKYGAGYLKEATKAFRGDRWMSAELTGPENAVSESNVTGYFTGDAEEIHHTPVLEESEWVTLIQKVAGGRTRIREHSEAIEYAAPKLRDGFAFEIWEAAKDAWKKNDLAWPALNLRLLGLILGQVGGVAGQVGGLREQVAELRTAIGSAAKAAESTAPAAYKEMLKAAIREYQDDLNAKLKDYFQRVFDDLAEVKAQLRAALVSARTVQVKEPLSLSVGVLEAWQPKGVRMGLGFGVLEATPSGPAFTEKFLDALKQRMAQEPEKFNNNVLLATLDTTPHPITMEDLVEFGNQAKDQLIPYLLDLAIHSDVIAEENGGLIVHESLQTEAVNHFAENSYADYKAFRNDAVTLFRAMVTARLALRKPGSVVFAPAIAPMALLIFDHKDVLRIFWERALKPISQCSGGEPTGHVL